VHRFEEHTGEVRLEVSAPTREALFAEAGQALAELMLGDGSHPAPSGQAQPLEAQAGDLGALYVEWLNELIFQSERSKEVFTRFEVTKVDATSVRAVAFGVHPEVLKTAVKAATLHGLSVRQEGEGWRASVVLDV
jgi:SHS2 domain-containing protein